MADINKIISEAVEKVINTINSDIITITDKNEMKNMMPEIWHLLEISYEKNGGFKTAKNPNALLKATSLIKICYADDKISACALYRAVDGYKMHAIGCDQTEIGKFNLQRILKDDIINYKGYFWCEVSGPIEHYFKKYNGFPIPNEYASMILDKEVVLLEDGAHYQRPIGPDGDVFTKIIYGFRNEKIYNKIMEEVTNYQEFMRRINSGQIVESVNSLPYLQYAAIFVVEGVYRMFYEDEYAEITPQIHKTLSYALKILKTIEEKNETIEKYIELAEYFIDIMPVITLNQF